MSDKNCKKPTKPLEPKKKPDGNFEIDKHGLVVFEDVVLDGDANDIVTYRR